MSTFQSRISLSLEKPSSASMRSAEETTSLNWRPLSLCQLLSQKKFKLRLRNILILQWIKRQRESQRKLLEIWARNKDPSFFQPIKSILSSLKSKMHCHLKMMSKFLKWCQTFKIRLRLNFSQSLDQAKKNLSRLKKKSQLKRLCIKNSFSWKNLKSITKMVYTMVKL